MTLRIQHLVQVWEEEGVYVARAVPLDVMSCAENPDDARRNLAEAVELFLKTASAEGTLEEVLAECGYVRDGEDWRAPKLLVSESVTQAVHA